MAYTLLHISDLHRSRTDPIGNDELMSTLLADRDRFMQGAPAIGEPDAIVVSGDLIQGAPLGTPNYEAVLADQYRTAHEFLVRLADEFLQGERARLVIVPGNHDVDWNMSFAAMAPVDDGELPTHFTPASCGPDDDWRWSWRERGAYRIINRALYDRRLEQFDRLATEFYSGADIVATELYRLHSLLGGRIVIAAFSSCLGNDCYSFQGAIKEEAMAQAHLDLLSRSGHELLIAVWHHSIEGDPHTTDYMAVSTVHRLIGKGFRVGMHGHQHRSDASLRYVHLPEEERMAVISAGSLCAGREGLPTGVHRQYNVLEIADDLSSARVHVREMAIATSFAPARRAEFGLRSFIDLRWQLPEQAARAAAGRRQQAILEAERARAEARYVEARGLLEGLPRPPGSYERRLLIEVLQQAESWQELIDEVGVPRSIEELVAIVLARAELGDIDGAESDLDGLQARLGLPDATARDMRNVLDAKRRLL